MFAVENAKEAEGFLIIFNYVDDKNYCWLTSADGARVFFLLMFRENTLSV